MVIPKGKKGDLPDLLIFVILTFIFGVGMFVFSFVIPAITTGLTAGGLNTTIEGESAIATLERYGTTGIQNGFMLLFAGLGIATLISSLFVRTHPAFIFLYIIFLIATIFIGTYLQNGYQLLVENEAFEGLAASTGSINTVFMNLDKIILGIGITSILIIFGKFSSFGNRAGSGGQL